MAPPAVSARPAEEAGWSGAIDLVFAPRAGVTALVHRAHRGPLYIQQPFYPEGAPCHVCLLHPPGGIVAGDTLAVTLAARAGAHVVVTNPAATKCYRSSGAHAWQHQEIDVAAGGCVEWLPQETIVFDGALVAASLSVRLAASARFIGWDVLGLGRVASGERFTRGSWSQVCEIYRDGVLVWRERAVHAGDDDALVAAWGLGGARAVGVLVAIGPGGDSCQEAVDGLRDRVVATGDTRFSVTARDGVLVCRCLASGVAPARACLTLAWGIVRWWLLGRAPCAPRIWST